MELMSKAGGIKRGELFIFGVGMRPSQGKSQLARQMAEEFKVMELKPDKGQKDGSCNRAACQKPGATWFNRGTYAYYCAHCASLINGHQDKGEEPLCSPPEESKP